MDWKKNSNKSFIQPSFHCWKPFCERGFFPKSVTDLQKKCWCQENFRVCWHYELYLLKRHIFLYLQTTFYISSIILTSFRQGVVSPSLHLETNNKRVLLIRVNNNISRFNNLSANTYLFKVNNRNTRKRLEMCSKLTINTSERRQWRCSGVFIVNFYCWHWTSKS